MTRATATLLALSLPALAWAGRPDDAAVWSEAAVEIEASDAVAVELGQQLRLGPPSGDGTEWMTDAGLSFEAAKWLDLGAGYRLDVRDWAEGPDLGHRVHLDATGSLRLGLLKLSLRERWQLRIPTADVSAKHTWRSRLKAKLATDWPVLPYAAVETFAELGDGPLSLDKVRLQAGLAIPLDPVELDVSYRLEAPVGDADDPRLHVLGLAVGWKL